MAISIIKDYIDQLQELKRRLNQIQAMGEVEISFPNMTDTIIDEDGGAITSNFSLHEWLFFKKKELVKQKRPVGSDQQRG